jgi:transcriptional regulator GlxA family with amidase domain
MEIAIPLFDRFTALDAVGPFQVLSALPGSSVRWVAAEPGPVRTDNGMTVIADAAFAEAPHPEVLVVPGGMGTRAAVADEELLRWIRAAHETSRWTTSVCTGSLLLGAAGLLNGLEATTHWMAADELESLGARYTRQRVVEHGKLMTAAGVSAGIDMALVLAERIADAEVAQAIQLMIEYDPQPPFDSGSPDKAAPEVVERLRGGVRARAQR